MGLFRDFIYGPAPYAQYQSERRRGSSGRHPSSVPSLAPSDLEPSGFGDAGSPAVSGTGGESAISNVVGATLGKVVEGVGRTSAEAVAQSMTSSSQVLAAGVSHASKDLSDAVDRLRASLEHIGRKSLYAGYAWIVGYVLVSDSFLSLARQTIPTHVVLAVATALMWRWRWPLSRRPFLAELFFAGFIIWSTIHAFSVHLSVLIWTIVGVVLLFVF